MRTPTRNPPGPSWNRRAGFGAPFVVVMSVLVLLSLYAVSMSVRSQGASQQTRKALFMETCEELAELALAEAVFSVRRHANDGNHPVFQPLREDGGGVIPPFDLAALVYTEAEIGRRSGYTLEPVEVEIARWKKVGKRANAALSYEAMGVLRFSTRVIGPESSSAFRELEIDYRTALTSVPLPFDAMTFFLGDTTSLLDTGAMNGDPNETIRFAVETLATTRRNLERTRDSIPAFLAQLNQFLAAAEALGFAGESKAKELRKAIQATTQVQLEFRQAAEPPQWPADPTWQLVQAGPTPGGPNTLHLFKRPLTVYSFENEVDLLQLQLPGVIGPLVQAFQGRASARQSALQNTQAAEANIRSDPMGVVGPLKRLLDVIEQDATDLHGMLIAYKVFQDLLVESSGKERDELVEKADRFYASEFRRKADYLFIGAGQAAKAAEFLKIRPPPVGVVYVDDATEPLVVDVEDLVGRLVVFGGHRVIVENARVRDPTQGALVVIANDEMKVMTQDIEASLACLTGDYFGPETSFSGSLLLGNLPDQRTLETALKGTITKIPFLAASNVRGSGPDASSIYAVLGPTPLYRRSGR